METNKKCEVCGKLKPHTEFSKSYKKRCKLCVAERTRSNRKSFVKKKQLDPFTEIFAVSVASLIECMGMFSCNQERLSNGLCIEYSDMNFSYIADRLRGQIESLNK